MLFIDALNGAIILLQATEDLARMASSGCVPLSDLDQRFATCALVGNSGIMLGDQGAGAEIDAHEVVLRYNEAPTKGFETHVGMRTTFLLISRPTSVLRQRSRLSMAGSESVNATYILLSPDHTMKASFDVCKQLRRSHFERELLVAAPSVMQKSFAFYRTVQRGILQALDEPSEGEEAAGGAGKGGGGGKNDGKLIMPSNCKSEQCKTRMREILDNPPAGVHGVYLALTMCKRVNLYGFGLGGDTTSASKCVVHPFPCAPHERKQMGQPIGSKMLMHVVAHKYRIGTQ